MNAMTLLVKDFITWANHSEMFTGEKCYLSQRMYFYLFRSTIIKETDNRKILPLPNPSGPQSSLLVTPP